MKKSILITLLFLSQTIYTFAQNWYIIPLPPGVTQLNDPSFTAGGNYAYSMTNANTKLFRFDGTNWDSIPLPPGVTQFGTGGNLFKGVGGDYVYASINSGVHLLRYNGAVWDTIPLPPGVTQLNDPSFTAGGNYAYSMTNANTKLFRFDGSNWDSIPLPPGVTQFGTGGSLFKGVGGDYVYASINSGVHLLRYNGAVWDTIPLPPGVTQLNDPSFTAGGNYAYSMTNANTKLFRFDGTNWDSIPLPPGVTQFGTGGSLFKGVGGEFIYASTDNGVNLYRFHTGSLQVEQWTKPMFSLYPNPTQGLVSIKFDNSDHKTIKILNSSGAILEVHTTNNSQFELDVTAKQGLLFVLVESENGVQIEKLMVE